MMEMNRRYIVYAMMATIVTLSSCAGEESEIQQSPPVPITVTVNNSNSPQTRNDETTPYNTIADLQTTGFGLYCQPGSLDPLMSNQKFTYNTTNGWTYSPIKYWPSGTDTKLNFIAYAPYTTTDKVSYDKTSQQLSYVYTVNTASPFDNIDLCTAVAANQTNSNNNGVTLSFGHQTARLELDVQVGINGYNASTKYYIRSVSISSNNSYSSGKLQITLSGGTPTISWDYTGASTLSYTISSTSSFRDGIADPGTSLTAENFDGMLATLNASATSIFPTSTYLTILPSNNSSVEFALSSTIVEYTSDGSSVTSAEKTYSGSATLDKVEGGHRYTLNVTLTPQSETPLP